MACWLKLSTARINLDLATEVLQVKEKTPSGDGYIDAVDVYFAANEGTEYQEVRARFRFYGQDAELVLVKAGGV